MFLLLPADLALSIREVRDQHFVQKSTTRAGSGLKAALLQYALITIMRNCLLDSSRFLQSGS